MTRNIDVLSLLAVLALAIPCPFLYATHGGPSTIEILGYEPYDRKVYYIETSHDEYEQPPQGYYFLLAHPRAARPVRIESWYSGEDPYGEVAEKEIARLRHRLEPLERVSMDKVRLEVTIESTGTFTYVDDLPPVESYRMRISLELENYRGGVDVIAFCRKGMRVVDAFLIPVEDRAIVVVEYTGNPTETCYDVQLPILLSREEADHQRGKNVINHD